ncbi:DUF2007 domain-containing protein [Massilia violaceinigra]|uniref:DUF2007 domain-containing protein n=1 Tax=Massilia violaceinigra TaxID=2045208 RepID=A0ABY4ABE7_9BURK|nr:DUF2007 domain-containing protein [Massilia violaceinigra]UOD31284.1 DUF2007 domain-containing protein [Massilia violaceinigra]
MQDTLSGAQSFPDDGTAESEAIPGRDLFIVAKFFTPTEAHLARSFLVASGIPAVVADVNHAQADQFLLPAMGGVRVLAPEEYLEQAQELLAAREHGDFTLSDDADVGQPEN